MSPIIRCVLYLMDTGKNLKEKTGGGARESRTIKFGESPDLSLYLLSVDRSRPERPVAKMCPGVADPSSGTPVSAPATEMTKQTPASPITTLDTPSGRPDPFEPLINTDSSGSMPASFQSKLNPPDPLEGIEWVGVIQDSQAGKKI